MAILARRRVLTLAAPLLFVFLRYNDEVAVTVSRSNVIYRAIMKCREF